LEKRPVYLTLAWLFTVVPPLLLYWLSEQFLLPGWIGAVLGLILSIVAFGFGLKGVILVRDTEHSGGR
jgi:hypothetical protein